MAQLKKSKTRKQRCSRNNNVNDSEYDVVDDPEETLNVHIQPARPPQADRDYADRDLPRSSSTQSLNSNTSGNSDIPPPCPPRPIPVTLKPAGPAVNRDLKPGRRRCPLDEKTPPVEPREQQTAILCRSLPASSSKEQGSGVPLQEVSRRDKRQATKHVELSAHPEDLWGSDNESANHTSIRYSLDLDAKFHTENSSHQKSKSQVCLKSERMPSRRQNHEWPQTKEDFDHHDFVSKEKPRQTYREEDWYVGACNRIEAEHALHLVNKDGAFLVRDCSRSVAGEPFVLAVYHEKKVYNVKIRFISKTSKYALGTGQRANDMFESVAEIIKFHSIFPIILVDGRNVSATKSYPENCVLTYPITRHDVDQLIG